jgi:pyruvate ferredoxin oxidoreductase beta subunit
MTMDRFGIYSARLLPKEELFCEGHRACQGCAMMVAVRHILKATGRNTIIANATGCLEIVSSPLPTTAWGVPWIHVAFENAAAVASGVEAALKVLRRKNKVPDREVTVLAFAGDGGTADIGFQALSGAMERGHNLLYVCFDNEAYMNTGIQRSSSTPFAASTTTSPAGEVVPGQTTEKKYLPEIIAAHEVPYVATANAAFPFDLYDKVRKAMNIKGSKYLHVYVPCPTGWRTPAELSIRYGRLAVESGFAPLYEVERGRYRLTVDVPEVAPIGRYLDKQGRFKHVLGTPDLEPHIQEYVLARYNRLRAKAGLAPACVKAATVAQAQG